MDYQTLYLKLLKKAELRINNDTFYTEKHHILPQCINKNNYTVLLSAREHFIAHQLLYKIYKNTQYGDLLFQAIRMMCSSNKYQIRNNREYEWVKRYHSLCQSKRMKGLPKTEAHKLKISLSHIGIKQTEESKRKIRETREQRKNTYRKRLAWNHGMSGVIKKSEKEKQFQSERMKKKNPMHIKEHRDKLMIKFTPVELERIINSYLMGKSLKEISTPLGISFYPIKRILITNNIPIRTQWGTRKLRKEQCSR